MLTKEVVFTSEPPWVTVILTSSTSLIRNMQASMALILRRRGTKRNYFFYLIRLVLTKPL